MLSVGAIEARSIDLARASPIRDLGRMAWVPIT
jgi:hypothetical protein